MFRIVINTDNDAFKPDPAAELEEILSNVSRAVLPSNLEKEQHHTIHDSNGNNVGFWEYVA